MTITKPVEESLQTKIATVEADLVEAERLENDADALVGKAAGLAVLGEIAQSEVVSTAETLEAARKHTSALRSALGVLGERVAAQDAAEAAERVQRLREESKAAEKAQTTALAQVAESAAQMVKALAVVNAQGSVLEGLHASLAAADPTTASSVRDDYRDAQADLARDFEQKRSGIRQAASAAQYQLQAPSDGLDPIIEADAGLVLLDHQVAKKGDRYSLARAKVLDFEVAALSALEDEEREAHSDAWDDFTANTETSGLGALSANPSEVRSAAALDEQTIAALAPDSLRWALAGLVSYLPKSPWEGIAVREIRPKDALSARQAQERLERGKEALALVANN